MKIAEVRKLEPRERFLYWIKERAEIRHHKQMDHEKPWTQDEILQNYYFTNVQREHDKVTTWFRTFVRDPLRDNPSVLFATVCFRWFNYIPTGKILDQNFLLNNWNLANCKKVLRGQTKIFTGAFNISNGGSTKPKLDRVTEDYITPVWKQQSKLYVALRKCPTMAEAHKLLSVLPGMGGSGFMAAQVICDLAYTHVLNSKPDWATWCCWGPGSKRGMNRVWGLPENYAMPRSAWHKHLADLQKEINVKLDMDLHARDVQNCLCEFGKYSRALDGDGHLKRRYPGCQN
jgi:hypothetical protein